jgi:imidazolonepropionase-like amidohydrolase
MTAAGPIYSPGHILLRRGVIEEVGSGAGQPPDGATSIDGHGMFVTPGIIDTHSHMGVYAIPGTIGTDDGNEATSPTTPEVSAESSFWPGDPAIGKAVSSGVTTVEILPGSANLIGGRSFIAHLRPKASAREMRFPGAVQGVKMACGENPKRVYGGDRHTAPSTRMGNAAGFRAIFQRAIEYRQKLRKYDRDLAEWRQKTSTKKPGDDIPAPPDAPERNLGLDTLVGVLDGKLFPQVHCYRADDLSTMLDIAEEFGFHIRSFHHVLEGYKIRDRLAKEGVAVSTWDDWSGFKMEAYDGIPQNAALLAQAGVRVIIHSDSELELRHLNQEAAKARTAGKLIGIDLDDNEILRWVTANPAWALGIDGEVGTLEKGKRADVVLWSGSPFSVYTKPVRVFIDGDTVFDSAHPRPLSDFELGRGLPGDER